jgi:hypothetical protein
VTDASQTFCEVLEAPRRKRNKQKSKYKIKRNETDTAQRSAACHGPQGFQCGCPELRRALPFWSLCRISRHT